LLLDKMQKEAGKQLQPPFISGYLASSYPSLFSVGIIVSSNHCRLSITLE